MEMIMEKKFAFNRGERLSWRVGARSRSELRVLRVLMLFLLVVALGLPFTGFTQTAISEAPAGFDNQTNGLLTNIQFKKAKAKFEEREEIEEGLGPVFNAQSCGECHQTPVTGGISQITELRAGHYDELTTHFTDHPGGSLINDRTIHGSIQETVMYGNEVRTFRTSLNTLGDGFVECVDDNTLIAISNNQPADMRGQVIMVPVLEANSALRVGRFGWKNQHASLLSFSADAYLNEMGITSPLQPTENTSNGRSLSDFDSVPDPEDEGDDVRAFAAFMRATKAPPRGAGDTGAGAALFNSIGCATCHTPTIVTAPPGTVINGGTFVVPPALGNKVIHPFGDFLLHDVGTGDGIVQNGGQATRNKVRTAPLWGLRTRSRLMHDGESLTFVDAIGRHKGEANTVRMLFEGLTSFQQEQLLQFLGTL
jgi:CxxC motif-containing protein (DUF1111 family)